MLWWIWRLFTQYHLPLEVVHFASPSTSSQDSPSLHVPFAKHGPPSTPCASVPAVADEGSSPTHPATANEPTTAVPMKLKTRSFPMRQRLPRAQGFQRVAGGEYVVAHHGLSTVPRVKR